MKLKTVFSAACMGLALLLTACGTGTSSVSDFITEEHMPYGATLVKSVDRTIAMQYDDRFVTPHMADTVHGYYLAVQENDAAAFTALQIPLYRDYYLGTVLGGKYTDEQIVSNTYEQLREWNEGDFVYSMIDITDCENLKENMESDPIVMMLDALAEEQNQEKFSTQISEYYKVTVTRYVTDKNSGVRGETGKVLSGEVLYLLLVGTEWKIIYS